MKAIGMVPILVLCSLASPATQAEDVTLEGARPVVVRTVPEAGGADVDPKLIETLGPFSKPMYYHSWSWAQESKPTFPTGDNKPKNQADKRTCVLPVKLEAG